MLGFKKQKKEEKEKEKKNLKKKEDYYRRATILSCLSKEEGLVCLALHSIEWHVTTTRVCVYVYVNSTTYIIVFNNNNND